MLGEEGRGAVLETCLAKIRFSSPPTHIIGMSATLGNLSHLASFLDAAVFTDSFRPVSVCTYVHTYVSVCVCVCVCVSMCLVGYTHIDSTMCLVGGLELLTGYYEFVL